MSTNNCCPAERQDLGSHCVAQPFVGDVQRRVLHSLEGDERLDPAERRVARQSVTPVGAVQSGKPAHPAGHLVDRHRPGGVARVGAARDDVLHDHQEVGALLVDECRVDRRMVKRQSDSRGEQPGFVVQAAGERDEFGVVGVDGLGEHRCGPGAGRVGQLQAGPPVRAVIAKRDPDVVHHCARMVSGKRRRHPIRGDRLPSLRNRQLREGHFRQLPPSIGSVTPVT